MKVFILTDLEGPAGVNGRPDNVGNKIINRPTAEQALVNEVNAVCEGLVAAGADEIVVLDGHGGSNAIDIFKLHPKASLMQVGNYSPAVYLDGSYDAFIQLGAHAMQHTDGFLCHTFNSHGVQEYRINGERMGEVGVCGMIAAYFNVPTILVSGDDVVCHEARELFGDGLEVVPTKTGINRYSAVNYPVQEVYENLRNAAERALRNAKNMPVLAMPEYCELTIRYMCVNTAANLEKTGGELLDEVTVKWEDEDFVEVWAQHMGWAPGVHKRKYGITPEWLHPHTLARQAFKK